jgi:hypothetical protein
MAVTKTTTKPTRLTRPKSKGSASIRIERQAKTKSEPELSISSKPASQPKGATVLTTNAKVLANLKPHQPTEAQIMEAMIPNPETAPKPKVKRAPPVNTRYIGSKVEKWDQALAQGGTYEALAAKLGLKASVLRAHLKFRVKSGKWRSEEGADGHVKMVAVGS